MLIARKSFYLNERQKIINNIQMLSVHLLLTKFNRSFHAQKHIVTFDVSVDHLISM